MKEQMLGILNSKKLVLNDYVIKIATSQGLNLNEFLVLLYFDNRFDDKFDVDLISSTLGMDASVIMEAFNSLMIKGLVSLESSKDRDNRNTEEVNLDGFYRLVVDQVEDKKDEETKKDVFKEFESELGRTISSRELELINGWLSTGISEEIILGALREAIYNGVTSLRYIDKIIYEWDKKGFKTMDDVNQYMKNRRESKSKDSKVDKKEQEILDYDWLDD